jgi:hypothetical protein
VVARNWESEKKGIGYVKRNLIEIMTFKLGFKEDTFDGGKMRKGRFWKAMICKHRL